MHQTLKSTVSPASADVGDGEAGMREAAAIYIRDFINNLDIRETQVLQKLIAAGLPLFMAGLSHGVRALPLTNPVAVSARQIFHEVWAYAKENPDLHSRGYDKAAFGYVQHFMDFYLDRKRQAALTRQPLPPQGGDKG